MTKVEIELLSSDKTRGRMALKGNAAAVKRIMSEIREINSDNCVDYSAAPLEVSVRKCRSLQDNLFDWHFTLRGPKDTPFEHGLYHGRILLPSEYPFRAPHVLFLTPNGRWQLNTKVR